MAFTEEVTRKGSMPMSMSLVTALDASFVCSVEKTRWPVSAAWMAISAVSRSLISPTRMTSGSCRTMEREYNQRLGEVVTGTVKRFENGDIILEMGRIEAVLPRKEQSRAESYAPGDRVRSVIKAVNRSAKGPQIMLSRTDATLLVKLFEQEVPEIYDGTVVVKGAVREAGDRAKVAVYSRERDVDPAGA